MVSRRNFDAGACLTNDLKLPDIYICWTASIHVDIENRIRLGVEHDCRVCRVDVLHYGAIGAGCQAAAEDKHDHTQATLSTDDRSGHRPLHC